MFMNPPELNKRFVDFCLFVSIRRTNTCRYVSSVDMRAVGFVGSFRSLLMYVGVVVLLRNLPLYGGRFDSPLIRDLESRRDVLTGQSAG